MASEYQKFRTGSTAIRMDLGRHSRPTVPADHLAIAVSSLASSFPLFGIEHLGWSIHREGQPVPCEGHEEAGTGSEEEGLLQPEGRNGRLPASSGSRLMVRRGTSVSGWCNGAATGRARLFRAAFEKIDVASTRSQYEPGINCLGQDKAYTIYPVAMKRLVSKDKHAPAMTEML